MNVPAGPWEAITESETEPYQVVGAYVVASDLPCEDAWLIAAAPDLYGALDEIVSAFERGAVVDGHAAIGLAKAALAKARGEST